MDKNGVILTVSAITDYREKITEQKIMKKKFISLMLVCLFAFTLLPKAAAAGFTDVPQESWAKSYISKAVDLGIIGGYGNGMFGYGDSVTRSQFAAMLVRLFHWPLVSPDQPTFKDNSNKTIWYYSAVETAVKNGAVTADSADFRPNDAITRQEMAVMLVRGLGYSTLAGTLKNVGLPFTDVTADRTSIGMAYDFGIINGTSPTTFNPSGSAKREEAAAMMIRLNDRYFSKLQWSHAFYAISSYGQKALLPDFNAVSFGWSRLEFDASGAPVLNTTATGDNPYSIPDGSQEVVQLTKSSGLKDNLSVFMSTAQQVKLPDGTTSDACTAVLTDAVRRSRAVTAITGALQKNGDYSGVTIDFEELYGDAMKNGLNLFLQELKGRLDQLGMSLYVCVHPVISDGHYYDGYDYKTIGTYADKVILMAHDYAAATLTAAEMSAGFTMTPGSPISEIYCALKAITNSATGVSDKSKIVLAVSLGSTEWEKKNGAVVNTAAFTPGPSLIYNRLIDPSATLNYSATYQDPYITYHSSSDNADYIIWYEDARSVDAKMDLAKMFGVNGISFWRLGLIPAYGDAGGRQIYYDIPAWLAGEK